MFVLEQDALIQYCLRAALLGALFAAVYLLFGFQRVLTERLPKPIGFTVQLITDLCVWGAVAFADILMVYSANRGKVRILALLLQAVAFLLCYLPLRRKVLKAETAVLSALKKVFIMPVIRAGRKKQEEYKIRRFNKTINKRMRKDTVAVINEIEQIFNF